MSDFYQRIREDFERMGEFLKTPEGKEIIERAKSEEERIAKIIKEDNKIDPTTWHMPMTV